MKKCCIKNLDKAKKLGRAKWVCPKCGHDVSLAYIFYQEAVSEITKE
jgi:ribosomal protein S27AE